MLDLDIVEKIHKIRQFLHTSDENMKIVRVTDGTSETYGFLKDDKIAIKSEITELTGVPIPIQYQRFFV